MVSAIVPTGKEKPNTYGWLQFEKKATQELQKLGVIDRIIKEPLGGAQRGRKETIEAVGKAIEAMLKELTGKKPEALLKDRRQKFLDMGAKGLAA